MTIEQAVAILEAERVLQWVDTVPDCGDSPDCGDGSAWLAYIHEAGHVVKSDPLFKGEFDDIAMLRECCGMGDCGGLCKCRD